MTVIIVPLFWKNFIESAREVIILAFPIILTALCQEIGGLASIIFLGRIHGINDAYYCTTTFYTVLLRND